MEKNNKEINLLQKNIKENPKIVFFQDVYESIGMSATTFYRHYPPGSEDYNRIAEALEFNRTKMKRDIRDRLAECKNPSGLVVLYRLLATDEEMDALNSIYKAKSDDSNKIVLKIE